jgi:hypothetical protein
MAAIAGVFRFRQLAYTDKIIALLIFLTLVNELLAFFAMRHYKNNLIVYHIYSPIELLMVSLYFDGSVRILRKTRIALLIGILGIPASIINAVYFQHPATVTNSYFLLFEAVMIIIYSLLSFHQILLEADHLLFRFAQFWITAGLLVYWSVTFTGWGIFALLYNQDSAVIPMFNKLLYIANYLLYGSMAVVFLWYKKLLPSGAS